MTQALGILQLGNRPMDFAGCLASDETFAFPTVRRFVTGAWVANTVAGDAAQEQAWIDAGQSLAGDGVAAITSNCGFALRYQAAVAAAVCVPVSLSSLSLLPYLLRANPPGQQVAVLTFDARHFDSGLITLSGASADAPIIIAGVEGTRCHGLMSREDNPITRAELIEAVLSLAMRVAAAHPISAFLFECAGFGAAASGVREPTGKPVLDATDNCRLLMAAGVGFDASWTNKNNLKQKA